jgi:transcriptional regulator with GAF, ATPase, and Fis domain
MSHSDIAGILAERLTASEMDPADRLRALIKISVSLMATSDPDEVIEHILADGIELFPCEGCSIALHDEASDELLFFAMAGAAKTEPFRIPADRGLAGHAFKTGEAVITNNAPADPRFFRTVDQKTGFSTRSIICSPVRQRGRVIGVMQAINARRAGGFAAADLELLTAFAAMAGAALTRAQVEATTRRAAIAMRDENERRYRLLESASAPMQEVMASLRRVAPTRATVLLLGESGTGKEVLARELHRLSPRAAEPFVAVNCTALTPSLLESELFGHEKGAFTGASQAKKGKFELANGGTVFLDEIGDLPVDLQMKLLRVLQEREVDRVGGSKPVRVDVRIIAATNRDLQKAMEAGSFREDLYFRLNVVTLSLPPLRERPEDVPPLARHILERTCREIKRSLMSFDGEALALLSRYAWPGNVRELSNVIERAAVLCPATVIEARDLPPELRSGGAAGRAQAAPGGAAESIYADIAGASLSDQVETFKRKRIESALAASGGNQAQAAKLLGLHQSNLSRLMRSLGMR